MTQFEFETRTKVNVSNTEFEAINEVYTKSDLNKDDFCKMWCKINASRVELAKEAAKEAAAKTALFDKLFDIAGLALCIESRDLYTKLYPDYISYEDGEMLEGLGIELRPEGAYGIKFFKTIGDVCYDVQKYIQANI